MKITKKIVAIGILVLSVVAILLVYNFVFTKKRDATDEVVTATKTLEERESELHSHFLSLTRYRKGIEEEHKKQDIIISHFPQTINEEDEIMFIDNAEISIDSSEDKCDLFFKSLNYGALAPFAEFNNDLINSHFIANKITLSGNYDGTYQGIKDIINHTNSQNNRMIINNLSASYDTTTGLLSGTIDFTMYAISGTDVLYTGPHISEVATGRNNIFGTVE